MSFLITAIYGHIYFIRLSLLSSAYLVKNLKYIVQ